MDTEPTYNILIVDADELEQDLISRTVQSLGHDCLSVSTGREAMLTCQKQVPDMVILDLNLSDISGVELCTWIRKQGWGHMAPILVLTQEVSVDKLEVLSKKIGALEGGANDYVQKPFIFQDVKARIGGLLKTYAFSQELKAKNDELEEAHKLIVKQERQIVANQLGGTMAHRLGQPLTAMKLNCHLLDTIPKEDKKFARALQAIKDDLRRLVVMIQELKEVDATKTETYHKDVDILDIEKDDSK